jgi:preprotein translocase subunit YajC
MKASMIAAIVLVNSLAVFAQDAAKAAPKQNPMSFLIMMGVVFAIIYFLMIVPQKKKQKETQNMLGAIKKGDKVVTIGGMIGTVGNVKDTTVMVKIADDTVVEYRKTAIAAILNDDGTDKVATPVKKDATANKNTEKTDK